MYLKVYCLSDFHFSEINQDLQPIYFERYILLSDFSILSKFCWQKIRRIVSSGSSGYLYSPVVLMEANPRFFENNIHIVHFIQHLNCFR